MEQKISTEPPYLIPVLEKDIKDFIKQIPKSPGVYKFLDKKIDFQELTKLIFKISNLKEFQRFKKIKPKSVDQINNLRNYVHLKIESLGI